MVVLQFLGSQIAKLHAFLLRSCPRLMVASLLIALTTGSIHWLSIRHPELPVHFQANLRTFPVEISFCALSLLSCGGLLSLALYKRHQAAKARRVRAAIRQRYIDYIVLCLMVSVTNSARCHLQSPAKEGVTLCRLEAYRQEIETAVARFRARARKLLHEPHSSLTATDGYLERYYRPDDDRFGEEILALKRDARSLMNIPAIKGLLDC